MASWTIYGANGVAKAVVKELELHDEWMAECYLTVTVKSHEPIEFEVGDYIDYRDDRYSINYDPTVLKRARRDSYGEGFVYDNIKFVAVQDEIVRCDFNDIVLSDNNVHYTLLPTFPFYCENVDDLLDRIQANLEELYPGGWTVISPDIIRNRQRGECVDREQDFINAYNRYFGSGTEFEYEKTGIAITANNNTCWDALKWVNEQFDMNFIVRGRVVIVGTAGVVTNRKFKYGKGNGLYEIERISDSEQKIITRLRGYGAETNLPNRYYAEMNARPFFNVSEINPNSSTPQVISVLIDNNKFNKVFTNQIDEVYGSMKIMVAQCEMDGIEFGATFELVNGETGCTTRMLVGADGAVIISGYSNLPTVPQSTIDALKARMVVGSQIIFNSGVNKKYVDSSHITYSASGLPDNMSINRLMLPGFPTMSLHDWVQAHLDDERVAAIVAEGFTFSREINRPYIDSPNKEIYGIRPSSIFFDGSDSDSEDIHPTIEGMTWHGRVVDEVVTATQIEDNGVLPDDTSDSDKEFTIVIPKAGFELPDMVGDDSSIDMKNGMCGARSFKIKKVKEYDDKNNWSCTCHRTYDDTLKLYFPYDDFQVRAHDNFVLTGIDLPDSYIEAASERLFFACVDALRANHAPRYTFQPRIDELWMQRQDDTAKSSGGAIDSLHDTLKAGDYFSFMDEDLGIDAKIIIDVLTIKENGNNGIPTYEVTLRDEKVVSALDKRIDKITSVSSGGVGTSSRQTQSLISEEGSELFLSKIYDDVAQGVIGFIKGAWFGAKKWFIDESGNATLNTVTAKEEVLSDKFVTSNYTDDSMFGTGGLFQYLNGKAKLVADMIVCRGKFIVNEIEDRIWTYSGGNLIFSAAGSTIFYVEYLDANDEPLGYTYVNSLWLLNKVPLLARIIAWSKRKKIQRQLTPAEKTRVVKFRCYETSDDGTMQTRNWWHVDDLAYCQTLNRVKDKTVTSGGYSGALSNTVYCRRVINIGSKRIDSLDVDNKIYDYVDLSLTDCDPVYNDWPAAGDVIVQRGNKTDTERQGFSTIEVTGQRRGLHVYDTVNDYTMEGKGKAFLGYNSDNKVGELEVFGDCYIGAYGNPRPHEGSTYIRYNSTLKKLEIKAEIDLSSTFGGQGVETYIDGLIHDITDAIQTQVDQKAETWYQAADPALQWTTAEMRSEHIGDLWHNTSNNKTFYYSANGWVEEYIPNDVFDTIDGKSSVYISQPSSYKANDLWILSAQTTLNGITYKKGEVLTASSDSDTFVASHWSKKVVYTDDEAFLNWKAQGYANDLTNTTNSITNAQNTANGAATAASNAQSAADSASRKATSAKDAADALEYVKTALKEHTTIQGGLVLATLIGLRSGGTTWAGINGAYQSGDTIAAWFGGGMDNNAPIVFRMNGSGHVADGNISWDDEGEISIFTPGIKIYKSDGVFANISVDEDGDIFFNNKMLVQGKTMLYGRYTEIVGYGSSDKPGQTDIGSDTVNINYVNGQSAGTTNIGGTINVKGAITFDSTTTFSNTNVFNSTTRLNGDVTKKLGSTNYTFLGTVYYQPSNSRIETFNGVNMVVLIDPGVTLILDDGKFVGQKVTVVRKPGSGTSKVAGKLHGNTLAYANISDGYEIDEFVWLGTTWASGYINRNNI